MANTLKTYLNFFWAAVMNHRQTGAVVPSQRFLISKMTAPVPEDYRGRIVELGAGNGALTVRLAQRCPHAKILACEINPALARESRENLAAAGINGRVEVIDDSAEHLLSEMGRRPGERPEFVLSGIPLGNLSAEKTRTLLDIIFHALADGGMYIQFQYSLVDLNKIKERFSDTTTVPVLLNFPPSVVYYARKGGTSRVAGANAASAAAGG